MPTKKKGTTHRVETGGSVSARSSEGAEGGDEIVAPTSPGECEELHQVQNYLIAKYDGTLERTKRKQTGKGKEKGDRVTMKLTYGEDGEVVSGVGKNNREALEALCDKLGESGFPAFEQETEE